MELPTGGLAGDLAEKINRASVRLAAQRAALRRRDNARSQWVGGVSHDVRTPLSMVLGYAAQLEERRDLPAEAREQAAVIQRQGERIPSWWRI